MEIFTLLLVVFISSCSNKAKITITKVEGSPLYENAKLSLDSIYKPDPKPTILSAALKLPPAAVGVEGMFKLSRMNSYLFL